MICDRPSRSFSSLSLLAFYVCRSQWHNYRSLAHGDWICTGAVTYRLRFRKLTAPGAVAFGAVTPDAEVNGLNDWAPGPAGHGSPTPRSDHSWGYRMEHFHDGIMGAHDEAVMLRLDPATAVAFGGPGASVETEGRPAPLPAVQTGDEALVTIDTAGWLTVKLYLDGAATRDAAGPDGGIDASTNAAAGARTQSATAAEEAAESAAATHDEPWAAGLASRPPPVVLRLAMPSPPANVGAGGRPGRRVLALALGLKYAGDMVSVERTTY